MRKKFIITILVFLASVTMFAPTVYGFDAMEFMENAGEDVQDETTESNTSSDASTSTPTSTPNESSSSDEAPEGSTLLPGKEDLTEANCEVIMRYVNKTPIDEIKEKIAKKESIDILTFDQREGGKDTPIKYSQILGCAITTGDVKAWMIPFFIRYILEFIIGLAGLIAVGGIVYGGYLYLFAGLSDDKDKGKNAIKNGIIGFVLVLTSWAIVNIVISLVTL